MNILKERKCLVAAVALVLVFAGCKGESPTAPVTSTTTTGVTPPTGAAVTLTVSNAAPLVNSTSVLTATVSENGAAVPNGTAVEFKTTLGTFADSNSTTTIRTTTNGVATATLSSAAAGAATVTATVGNVAKSASVVFSIAPTVPQPPDTAPTITSVSPATGRPQGGEVLTITGKNFRVPVRVLFDFGTGLPVEATVISTTATQIQVLTPSVDLGTGQTKDATITIINEAGTTNEVRVTASAKFTYQATVLTPKITAVSPASGPIDGGTRVTIFGEGFQAPVQVFFGSAEVQVLQVTFSQLTVFSPAARDTSPTASTTVTGPVPIKVININSATTVTADAAFRYIAKIQITAISPTTGSAFGGTTVRIDGTGFNDPITVTVGDLAAQVVKVSPTEILVVTPRTPVPCTPVSGAITVTNVDNGDTATSSSSFTYNAEKPTITAISPSSVVAGSATNVTVASPGVGIDGSALIRFRLGTNNVSATPSSITNPGTQTFSVVTPSNTTFATAACTTSAGLVGTKFVNLVTDVTFTNVTTGCTDTVVGGLTLTPPSTTCVATTPSAAASVSPVSFCGGNTFGSISVLSGASESRLITISNTAAGGSAALTYTSIITGTETTDFTVAPASGSVPAGSATGVTVTFKPTSAVPTSRGGNGGNPTNLTIFTNDPANPTFTICLHGTASP